MPMRPDATTLSSSQPPVQGMIDSQSAMAASKNSIRNNFENKESRKAILKNALAEIEAEIGTI